ncbi:serine/threonine protein kinase [Nocardiopsis coralliicola]
MASGSDSTGAPVPSALRPLLASDPRQIGPFRIAGRIGQGGMGTVFGALDGSGACIAVKAVAPQFADDPDFRTAFAREIEAVRRVGGVCTPAVIGAAADAPVPWLATSYVPGPTLEAHIRGGGTFSGDQLTAFAAGLAEALTAVHAAGVVHCDIKPGNVILAPDGPKLVDFGVAEPAAAAARPGAPLFGSPGWLAPERYDGAAPAPSSDVFSWAAVVAFAATGRAPFGTGDTGERTRRSREEEADLDGAPAGLVPMLRAALAKDPAARPDAESIYRGLVDFTLDEDISAIPTPDLQSRLQSLLSRTWTGFGSTGHDPGAWADALEPAPPGDGAASGPADAAGAPPDPGGALGDAAADIAAETAAAGVAAAGTAGGSAGAGAAATASTGGVGGAASLGTIGAGKLTAVVSAAVIGTAGVGLGGMYAAGGLADDGPGGQPEASASPSGPPSPKEAVAAAIDRIETTDSYLAREDQGDDPEWELASPTDEWVFRADPDFYQWHRIGGGDSVDQIVDAAGEREFILTRPYGTDFQEDPNSQRTPENMRNQVVAPFEEIAETMEVTGDAPTEVDGAEARRIEGSYTGTLAHGFNRSDPMPMTFSLWVADDGTPLRLDFTPEDAEGASQSPQPDAPLQGEDFDPTTTWTYTGFDGELDRWNCGTVEYGDGSPVLLTTSPEVDCATARSEMEFYIDQPPEELDGNALSGGDNWQCGSARPNAMGETYGPAPVSCFNPAEPTEGAALLPSA